MKTLLTLGAAALVVGATGCGETNPSGGGGAQVASAAVPLASLTRAQTGGVCQRIGDAGWQYEASGGGGWRVLVVQLPGAQVTMVRLTGPAGARKLIGVSATERWVSWEESDSLAQLGPGARQFARREQAAAEARTPRGQEMLRVVESARAACSRQR